MRAGLLSDARVIERLNNQFVCTWVLIHDAKQLADRGNTLAETVSGAWEYPLDLMFLSPDGELISKLNSFRDLRGAHAEVGHPPDGRNRGPDHFQVFLSHLDRHFGPDYPGSSGNTADSP